MNIKILLLLLLLLPGNYLTYSQEPSEQLTETGRRPAPVLLNLQFAGGAGLLSAGAGYTFLNQRIDLSLNYGYVPAFISSHVLHILTFRSGARLLRFQIGKTLELFPLNLGIIVHHHIGREFWIKLPAYYRNNYYWWAPGLSPGMFWNFELKTKLLNSREASSGTAFYTHLGTRDLYIVSKYGNSSLPFKEVVEFGVGIRVYR